MHQSIYLEFSSSIEMYILLNVSLSCRVLYLLNIDDVSYCLKCTVSVFMLRRTNINITSISELKFNPNKMGSCNVCFLQCQVAIEIPYTLLQVSLYALIVYAMMGYQWTATKFFLNFFFMYITILYFIYYGMMVISVSPNQATATILSGLFYSFWNLFTGFVIPRTVSCSYHYFVS